MKRSPVRNEFGVTSRVKKAQKDMKDRMMIKKTVIAMAAVAAFGLGSVNAAHAFNFGMVRKPNVETNEKSRGLKPAPIAYQLFCFKNASECRGGGASVVPYDAGTMAKLSRVNREVNASIRPQSDKIETWTLNPSAGDCEDYALTKRSKLVRAGIPSSALRIADVTTRHGERHAVLVVKTTRGDYVLDNLRGSIVKRQFTGYRFNRIASANPRQWTDL